MVERALHRRPHRAVDLVVQGATLLIVLLHAERRECRAHHLLRATVRIPDERFQSLQGSAVGAGREEELHIPTFRWCPVEDRKRHGLRILGRDQGGVHHLDIDAGFPDLDRAVDVSVLLPRLERDAVVVVPKLFGPDVVPDRAVPLRVIRVHALCRVVIVELKRRVIGQVDRCPVGVRHGKGRIHGA